MHDLMLADLERLICCESPSSDLDALHRCADVLTGIGTTRLGQAPVRTEAGGRPVLRFGPADPAVLLLGHLDTVHPIGTLEQTPYRVIDGRVYGPGVFDMKLGLVQALHAMAACASRDDVGLLVTADEELGSPASRTVIEAAAAKARAVLVLEASVDGKLKTARKGVSTYDLRFTGRAAHAGLEPEKGANTSLALAQAILAISDLADTSVGTTVTPTVARSGVTINTVPDTASLAIDGRAASKDEQDGWTRRSGRCRARSTACRSRCWVGSIARHWKRVCRPIFSPWPRRWLPNSDCRRWRAPMSVVGRTATSPPDSGSRRLTD